MKTTVVDGVGFNTDWTNTVTESEFVKHFKSAGIWAGDKQDQRLKEAYQAIKGKTKIEPKE